jgi:hypothetical protein
MANDKIRIQVHENTTEDDWKNVGFASSDLSIPVTETNPISTTGLATSAKQLPDNHQVTVSNLPITSSAVDVNLKSGDIEIGAVEIKNAGDDTRATVDANGLWTRSTLKETVPTDPTKTNPSTVLSYNATTELVRVVKTINGTSYTKNVTPLSGDTVITQTKTFGVWT